ncbi:SHOCT domain-containing protein [Adhaeribacter radiodurans]|uniref:SHOCT domain-containing protein n=1 Tax=Adhaeribacter radiodurans TaxID=2745197 RepID=A0A7L7L3D3_9BACT|nr:SHOCT domain-containing protein [Adhaeribacter radiodurans]QMU27283.1 SHOCT domain-containing protein [Adhaeribacter radiodurans]
MDNENSTIRSLNELKTLYDSGAITAEEYDALKKRIIFGSSTPEEPKPIPEPAPIMSSSPEAVNPIETRIIYPTGPATPEPPIAEPPVVEQNFYNEEESPMGVRPAPKKDWLLISLAVLGALLLLGLLAYQFFNKPQSERLTSKSGPDTEEIIPDASQEESPGDSTEILSNRSDRIPVAGSDSTTTTSSASTPETTSETITTPDETVNTATAGLLTDKTEVIRKAQEKLNAYYADIQEAPFEAANYFAPQVERYYTLSNTTPAAINVNINTYHFPEFLNGQSSIQAGSMEVVSMGNNSYELTYLENGSAFRKSKNQKQETKAAVRVRFNPDFKITYFRQEQLLENRFITE